MKTFEQLAASAFAAYRKEALRTDEEGLAQYAPKWEELEESTRQCWIAATKQVVAEAALIH